MKQALGGRRGEPQHPAGRQAGPRVTLSWLHISGLRGRVGVGGMCAVTLWSGQDSRAPLSHCETPQGGFGGAGGTPG